MTDIQPTPIPSLPPAPGPSPNRATTRANVEAVLSDLRQITASTGSLSALQLSNASRACAKALIGLIRIQLEMYDGVD